MSSALYFYSPPGFAALALWLRAPLLCCPAPLCLPSHVAALRRPDVVVKGAFSKELADEIRSAATAELEEKGVVMDAPESWADTPAVADANGYIRTGGDPQFHVMASRGDAATVPNGYGEARLNAGGGDAVGQRAAHTFTLNRKCPI